MNYSNYDEITKQPIHANIHGSEKVSIPNVIFSLQKSMD